MYGPNNPAPCPKCSESAHNRIRTKAKRYSSYMECGCCGYMGPKVHNTSWPRLDDYEVAAMAWNDEYKVMNVLEAK